VSLSPCGIVSCALKTGLSRAVSVGDRLQEYHVFGSLIRSPPLTILHHGCALMSPRNSSRNALSSAQSVAESSTILPHTPASAS
jgi:hypothetical protein